MNNAEYSKLSNREIDRLVLNIIYGVHANDKDIQGCWSRGGFKYTSDPSDAWSIIYNNNITVCAPMNTDEPSYWLCYDTNNSDTSFNDKNPLRAAIIVFLKMQESKNVSERMLNNLENTLKTENFDTYE